MELKSTSILLSRMCSSMRLAFRSLNLAEFVAAIGERDLVAGLVRQAHGGFHRAVAAADDQNVLVSIVIGFNQAVEDVRKLFALDSEFTRRTGAAEREHHGARACTRRWRVRTAKQAVGMPLNTVSTASPVWIFRSVRAA